MSTFHPNSSGKEVVYILLVLAAIAGSLVTIFYFLSIAEVSEMLALVLFLAVAGLLIVGYMVAIMVLGLAIVPVAKLVRGLRDRRSVAKRT